MASSAVLRRDGDECVTTKPEDVNNSTATPSFSTCSTTSGAARQPATSHHEARWATTATNARHTGHSCSTLTHIHLGEVYTRQHRV
jgi:hypothetical protein